MMPPVVTFSLRGSSPIGNLNAREIYASAAINASLTAGRGGLCARRRS